MTLHCAYCGQPHTSGGWPKTCKACGQTTWKNPTPVAVALVPVDGPRGLVVIRRGIEPQRGALALPGGYVDWEEDWRAACAREVREETGIVLNPAVIRPFDVASPPDGRTVLLFGMAPPQERDALPPFEPTDETTERAIIERPCAMAFPLHLRAVERFFAE